METKQILMGAAVLVSMMSKPHAVSNGKNTSTYNMET